MARQTKQPATSRKLNSGKSSSAKSTSSKSQSAGKNPRAQASVQQQPQPTLLDDSSKRKVSGIIIIAVAVILFVCAVVPMSGLVSSIVSSALHLSLGIGAYLLPFFLIGFGVSTIIQREESEISARVAIGLLVIFIAVLVLLALFTNGASDGNLSNLFKESYLVALGGYIGAGPAWVFLKLFGHLIGVIICVFAIIVGLIILGISLSGVISDILNRRDYADALNNVEAAPPYARVRNGQPDAQPQRRPVQLPASYDDEDATRALPSRKQGRKSSSDTVTDPDATQLLPSRTKDSDGGSKASSQKFSQDFSDGFDTSLDQEPITRKLNRKVDAANPPSTRSVKKTSDANAPQSKSRASSAKPSSQSSFKLPPLSMLTSTKGAIKQSSTSAAELKDTAQLLQNTLEDFGIYATVVDWEAGPTFTLFKVALPTGVRVNRITNLTDDIALALASPGVRIFSPVLGTKYVGIEVPNKTRSTVLFGDIITNAQPGPLQIAIGKDVEGNSIVSDLAKMPHLLIGGTTGSGKTVAIHSMIMSILMRATPDEARFILIDPKRVEFSRYNGIPNLYVPVVTEAKEAASALAWGVAEMERRLKLFQKAGASNIAKYNAKVRSGTLETENASEIPYIVIVVDELADLMMNCGKEVENSISRIAQLARAAGIHLILATQRPSTNVVTGLIKANITNRIALTVATGIDSRVILDSTGAENLINNGDLLYGKPEYSKPQRIQGCFVSDEEIDAVVSFLKTQGEPDYHSEILSTNLITLGASQPDGSGGSVSSMDPLLWEAAEIVVSSNLGSTSNIQRRLSVGYSRAGRIMDQLEEKGIVGPPNGSKPRDVLVDEDELIAIKALEAKDDLEA